MIKYEVIASTGTYTDKNGQEKKRWQKCGVVMETKNGGLALKMEVMPINSEGWFMLTEPKAKDDAPKQAQSAGLSDIQEDIPF